jgi:hypothetical protein
MSIESRRELELTRAKLKLLEERLAALVQEPEENPRAREWSIRSLKQTINQLVEEMARFESRAEGAAQNLEAVTVACRRAASSFEQVLHCSAAAPRVS